MEIIMSQGLVLDIQILTTFLRQELATSSSGECGTSTTWPGSTSQARSLERQGGLTPPELSNVWTMAYCYCCVCGSGFVAVLGCDALQLMKKREPS